MSFVRCAAGAVVLWSICGVAVMAEDFSLHLREQKKPSPAGKFARVEHDETWPAAKTAVIVCDVWDYHHCLNAVRRLDEFLPRLNNVVQEARRRGATIIHSPSDCMDAYADHPARLRARQTPAAPQPPRDIEHWCSRIPGEERADYPIDQSDGGEDDDPAEHREWAAKLKELGRNPGMPWKRQNDKITIDPERDFLSDRGDEVWNILAARGIDRVILTGVHVNMCVLGRPFGLRQLARNGKRVVLMRDMTDAMYNPQRWPYVDHFTGNDLVISHIERHVCPTITSDQLLGGRAFRFQHDQRKIADVMELDGAPSVGATSAAKSDHWTVLAIPSTWNAATRGVRDEYAGVAWYRCAVRTPSTWLADDGAAVRVVGAGLKVQAWCNGRPGRLDPAPRTAGDKLARLVFPRDAFTLDEANLIVLRVEHPQDATGLKEAPALTSGERELSLRGRWQFRLGDAPTWSNIPLPAKFGVGTDYLFEAPAP